MTTGLSAVIQARKPAFHVCLLATPSNRNSNANKICIGYNTTKLVSLCDHIIQHYTKNRKPFFQKASCSWEIYVMIYYYLIILKSSEGKISISAEDLFSFSFLLSPFW